MALVVGDHVASRALRTCALALGATAVLVVIHSRLYRGMHYPTDVLAGVTLGIAVLIVVRTALARSAARADERGLAAGTHG